MNFRGIILMCGLIGTCIAHVPGQANTIFTHAGADAVLHGNYSPATYQATQAITDPHLIAADLQAAISADSLRAYVAALSSFQNRNSGSDTVSDTKGIGAARRWAYRKFAQIGQENENRLLPGYLQFDRSICTAMQHRNVVAVLPGMDTSAKGFVLVEAHLDSRCAGTCDTACIAYGADDNGSGCALVLELARVMSRNSYRRTVVFMLTIAEEQGLYGAEALSDYCRAEEIPIHAVLNSDVVGGVHCGNTSSPPSCPGAGDVDSLNLRLFSFGGYNSLHKQLARFCKLEYQEVLSPHVTVPMGLHIMAAEDRSGRGGDHIPFRQGGFTAMRFTCANEHGNGSPAPGYTDHQHTSADSLGVDTDLDGEIDSLWIDFNYLARNTVINANAASMIALGPETPDFDATKISANAIAVELLTQLQYGSYRVGIRTLDDDWDTVYTIQGPLDTLLGLPATTVILSVASVDAEGTESLFSRETYLNLTGTDAPMPLHLLPNRPNPFDEATRITVQMDAPLTYAEAHISISDMEGREIQQIPITLEAQMNEVLFQHGYHATGVYFYSIVVDGKVLGTGKMVME
ncbi:MAG TPA: M20/M25/M40 family metallo-hydrolase [Bacteroidia bacterium]|nr:M20/M25/M40 family metallo-hydrolase [Bacteroidia bacterium]